MKSKRQEEILALIQEQNIETQNQLIEALRKRGVKSTQATLSRDIRELRLVKELSPDGGYRYTVPRGRIPAISSTGCARYSANVS